MGIEGHIIILILILKNLHHTAISRERRTLVNIQIGKSKKNKEQ
jgi:hypothetical protein